ncbi:hypothetical protein LPJ56_006566, partial [Coemansia sp. RSA 2599]
SLVYEKPRSLVHNAAETQNFVEFSNGGEEVTGANELSVLATPGHDMYVQMGHAAAADGAQIDWSSKDYAKVKASAIVDNDAEHLAVRFLAHAAGGIKHSVPSPTSGLSSHEHEAAFLELYGYLLGDGAFDAAAASDDASEKPVFVFGARKPADYSWIEGRLAALGLEAGSDFVCLDDAETGQRCYQVASPAWAARLADKQLWSWSQSPACDARCARAILFGLRAASGSEGASGDAETGVILASSAHFRDQVQALALHAGYASSFRLVRSDSSQLPCADADADAEAEQWAVRYESQPLALIAHKRRGDIKYTARTDASWCATMPSGYVVVRRVFVDSDTKAIARASVPTIQGNCLNTLFSKLQINQSIIFCNSTNR